MEEWSMKSRSLAGWLRDTGKHHFLHGSLALPDVDRFGELSDESVVSVRDAPGAASVIGDPPRRADTGAAGRHPATKVSQNIGFSHEDEDLHQVAQRANARKGAFLETVAQSFAHVQVLNRALG
uniref:(northern house mosquito) hypothetical protein n=1 Tax=Culex pipiens TaxID=7175 RepID=A0A8D8CA57_CULPI